MSAVEMSSLFKNKPFVSFEIFPPKTTSGKEKLYRALEALRSVNPEYISVTYGAGGGSQKNSFEVCRVLHEQLRIPTMAHYTCVGQDEREVVSGLRSLLQMGIERYMLLRGDRPRSASPAPFEGPKSNELAHACDLVALMNRLAPNAIVGVAGYPEKHMESSSIEEGMRHLKTKVDAGADFIVTQMFFENDFYLDFRSKAKSIGIKKPIVPGVMPIANAKQVLKIADLCNATIPKTLLSQLETASTPNEVRRLGTDFAVRQCRDLLRAKVDGLHFYTLNNADQVLDIIKAVEADLVGAREASKSERS